MTISVLLVDDHVLVLRRLKALLRMQDDLLVGAIAAGGRQAVMLAAQLDPDVAVIDVQMPGMDGYETARRIRKLSPRTRLIMLSLHDDLAHVHDAQKVGAAGYVLKDWAPVDLAEAIRAVHAGQQFLSRGIPTQGATDAASVASLSARERQVLGFIADGCSNSDAARSLGLSVKTVETYRSRLMQKLAFHSVADLAKFALKHGLTRPA